MYRADEVAGRSSEDERFIQEHQALVRSIAQKVRAQLDLNCDLDDLIAFGFQGLLEARGRFDASRGVQFNTFAYYRIRGAIIDGVRQMAYLPRRVHARARAAAAGDWIAEEVGVTRAAVPAERTNLDETVRTFDETLGRLTACFVLAAVGQSPDDAPKGADEALIDDEQGGRVRRALGRLAERERALVEGFYFEGRQFDEVAAELGISKSWASRLHAKALSQLRAALEEEEIPRATGSSTGR